MKNKLKIIIVVVVAIILISTAFLVLYHPTQAFTDTAQTSAPPGLDPATAFFVTTNPLLAAVFQNLVEYNGSSTTTVPVLASNIYNINNQNFTFDIRSDAHFSNGQQLNATSVWFSLARGIVMGQGPFTSNYGGLLYNQTLASATGIFLPVGIIGALKSAGYYIPNTTYNINGKQVSMANYTIAGSYLANLLSDFNYNTSEMKVMEYKNQALVVNSNDNITINTEHTYSYFLDDLAGVGWGEIIEPSYVDAHDGVKVNSENSYINLNGAIGSGPYVISSVGKGFSTIVIKANPDYWVTNTMISNGSVPAIAKPASIKTVVIDYGLDHADRLEDFDRGISQISTVSPSSFKQMIDGFHNKTARTNALIHSYKMDATCYISMNMHKLYTNNTNFREALYDAMNYSAQLKVYDNNYNHTSEAYEELGPLSPIDGLAFYNPDNLPMPAQNITAALKNITLAGDAMHFYVKLPNGTKIGDTSGTDLSKHTFTITAISPLTSVDTAKLSVAISSLGAIGLTFTTVAVTESTTDSWTTANSTPQFVDLGWFPDFPDPVGQQLMDLTDVNDGGYFGANFAWVDNSSLQTYYRTLDFLNHTEQVKEMKNVSRIVYNQYSNMWMPVPNDVWFVAPDVHGFVFNIITTAYFYNLMTVTGKLTSSVGYMPIYSLVVDIEMAFTNAVPKL